MESPRELNVKLSLFACMKNSWFSLKIMSKGKTMSSVHVLKMFNFHLKGGAVHKRNFLKDSFELSVSKILKRF